MREPTEPVGHMRTDNGSPDGRRARWGRAEGGRARLSHRRRRREGGAAAGGPNDVNMQETKATASADTVGKRRCRSPAPTRSARMARRWSGCRCSPASAPPLHTSSTAASLEKERGGLKLFTSDTVQETSPKRCGTDATAPDHRLVHLPSPPPCLSFPRWPCDPHCPRRHTRH